jgi:hypothetical protein
MNETSKPKSGWRVVRRILIALAVLATLVAIFYTEEDWRGKRVWENCKRELEAQGVVLDWDKFLPPSVPDDQNFFTASTNILLRFKYHESTNDPDYEAALANPWLRLQPTSSNSYPTLGSPVVAKIIVSSQVPVGVSQDTNTILVGLNDPAAAERARNLINTVIGPHIQGAAGFQFYKTEFKNIRPAQIYVQAEIKPSRSDLQTLIPADTELTRSDSNLRTLISSDTQLMSANAVVQKNFDVALSGLHYPTMTADDYLKWSDQYAPAFADIREALKRPYAILPGDYSQPYEIPIPNFVTMRALAQTLAQRAQCYLLLGEPDKALPELALIHDVCRILEKPPTGKPETLLEAMIDVALTGLYEQVIEEGFQRHAWQEPQLAALQEQLAQINLPPCVFEAFQEQPARVSRNAEIIPLQKWFSLDGVKTSWPTKATLRLMPRGWIYQNIIIAVQLEQLSWVGFDPTKGTISPQTFDTSMDKMQTRLEHYSPYYLLADIAFPNYAKAWQVTAYNQTLVNEAQIGCALERYRLSHGEYPETLNELIPQYMQTIPHDIIGGQPLHYRRTDDGKFLLYSVGWNEIDDGGQEQSRRGYPYTEDYSKGDWVWPVTAK